MGFYTNASAPFSTALGASTTASGWYSTAMGDSTTAKSGYETVIGIFNTDYSPLNITGWNAADRLFVIGNGRGVGALSSNAMTVLKNGNTGIGLNNPAATIEVVRGTGGSGTAVFHGTTYNSHFNFSTNENTYLRAGKDNGVVVINDIPGGKVGIGTNVVGFPLSFGEILGDKISLWSNSGNSYGFGVQGSKLQIHTDVIAADVVFGYGSSAAFTETMRIRGNGNVGIGTTTPDQKLTVAGDICATGWIATCSDIRYKTNLAPLSNSLDNVLQMHGVYYFLNKDLFPEKNFSDKRQIGFSAQELEELVPEIVQTDSYGYKSVDYSRMTPILVEAIKEQQLLINKQQQQLDQQQTQIDEMKKLVLELSLVVSANAQRPTDFQKR